ncbi:hypothetical protein ACOMHD_11855 [Xanthomonas codiaei]|uniref:hypothetical protein n=1 Tax=Xanthomonas codiaei TaxID=56463 RepID=UPI00142D8908|nr:hypothetical protein [Xanthomonas codiaei]
MHITTISTAHRRDSRCDRMTGSCGIAALSGEIGASTTTSFGGSDAQQQIGYAGRMQSACAAVRASAGRSCLYRESVASPVALSRSLGVLVSPEGSSARCLQRTGAGVCAASRGRGMLLQSSSSSSSSS